MRSRVGSAIVSSSSTGGRALICGHTYIRSGGSTQGAPRARDCASRAGQGFYAMLLQAVLAAALAAGADSTLLRILTINDFHGALEPRVHGWSSGRPVGGAAARKATLDWAAAVPRILPITDARGPVDRGAPGGASARQAGGGPPPRPRLTPAPAACRC